MTDINESINFPGEKKALPTGINVLTILTFIWSGFEFLGYLWQFFGAKKSIESMEEAINSDKFDDMPAFLKGMMTPEALEIARKQYENRIPIFIIGLLAVSLCVFGAIQMRKQKQQGYFLYVIGEILPIISMLIFVGFGFFSGFKIIGLIFPVAFIILYTMQRKHLRN
jgi:hypothetical protein